MPDDAPNQPLHRVRVFVVFWNYTLSVGNADTEFRADWAMLGPHLTRAAAAVVDVTTAGKYQGLNFYGSHDPASDADRRLHRWATTVVDRFPGVNVSIVPRQRKRLPPVCLSCRNAVAQFPNCR